MSERNGPDIAAVYQLLTEVARIVAGHDRRFDEHDRRFDAVFARLDEHDRRFDEHAGKLNELIGTVNDHTRKLDELALIVNRHSHTLDEHGRKLDDLVAGLTGLRETVAHYHLTVVGHGLLYSELEERVRRLERHLHLDPAGR